MAISNEEFEQLIKTLPKDKLIKLKKFAQKLASEKDTSFDDGVDYLLKNYDQTLERLKDR